MKEKSLGETIRDARKAKGWGPYDFAEKLGRKYPTIYRQERDRENFGDETLEKACKLLGLDYPELLKLKYPKLAADLQLRELTDSLDENANKIISLVNQLSESKQKIIHEIAEMMVREERGEYKEKEKK